MKGKFQKQNIKQIRPKTQHTATSPLKLDFQKNVLVIFFILSVRSSNY